MLNKEMKQVQVYTSADGFISISQEKDDIEIPFIIEIHPDQVDILVEWLKDAKKDLESNKLDV